MEQSRILVCSFLLCSILFSSCEKDPVASFTVSKSNAMVNEIITFSNTSENASSYLWEFGDGNSSTEENPTHSYSDAGNFTVTLTASGNGIVSFTNKIITIYFPAPAAGFTMDKTEAETGETISFNNTSQNATSYLWQFGDGDTSTEVNPTHSYSSSGSFDITLTATGAGGENSTSKTVTITANFNGSWKAGTTESDANLTSATAKFNVEGTSVSVTNWSVSTSIGYFWGMGWSATLNEDKTFSFSPEIGSLKLIYTITLLSSSSGTGTFTYLGKEYAMDVSKQ